MRRPFRVLDPRVREDAFADRCAFAVMAKAPIPGKVKTRLTPPLTPAQAALLNAAFLTDTLENLGLAAAATGAACAVSYTPAGWEHAFEGILPVGTLLLPQRGDGFGERLLATAEDLFACGFAAVCLIDSDSPTVPTAEFVHAARALSSFARDRAHPAVLGRSDDGGYYLLGVTAPHAELFADVGWSTAEVADQTEQRAAEIGLRLHHLRTWYDVDEAVSLERLRQELDRPGPSSGYVAPHTRACLRELRLPGLASEDKSEVGSGHGSR
ncbi:MAG TPA: TIGR04282 family arsenosugar biosynthesis glycosyltransferase [Acidobacteriaceae bacterium]